MSGIGGIIHFDGKPVDPGLIERMTAAMAHRGPDGINHWVRGSVALGQCMLRATPESLEEHQPLTNEDESLVLVMDGRVDNREEIEKELVKHGIRQRTRTDAELVLRAFQLWGDGSPSRLLGDFAYAVWDVRQQRLFCARDHVGAKPFYYTRTGRLFAFASEDEALLGLPGVSNQPNEDLIAHALSGTFLGFEEDARSWLRDIFLLRSGQHVAVCRDGNLRRHTYWRFEPGDETTFTSDEECQDAFLNVFSQAIRCRMRGPGDIAAMMSGGMDSAGIAATVKRLLRETPGKKFHTYSAIADRASECIESQCILSLTRDFAENAHFVLVPSMKGMVDFEDLSELAWSKAHPVDNSLLLPAIMCLAASRAGHRVLLHGVSGDVTMCAPQWYAAYLMHAGSWREAWRECQFASRYHTYLRAHTAFSLLLRNAWAAYGFASVNAFMHGLHLHLLQYRAGRKITAAFARRLRLKERMRSQLSTRGGHSSVGVQEAHAEALNSRISGISVGLTGYDRVAGRFGVELRDPWADRRVIDFFLSLPLQYKVRSGRTKYLARSTFRSSVGSFVTERLGKEHVGWQLIRPLMYSDGDFLSSTFDSGVEKLQRYVDVQLVRARWLRSQVSASYSDSLYIYGIISLLVWLRRIENLPANPVCVHQSPS